MHAQRATEIGAAWLLAAGAHSSPTPFGVLFSAFWCVVQRLLVRCSAPVGVLFCLGIGLSASNTEPVCTRCETHCSSLSQESENIPKRLRILVKSETKKSCPERYCLSKFAWKFVVGTRCHGQF